MMIILQNVYDNNEGTILSVQPFKNNDDYIVLSLGLFQLIHKMGKKKKIRDVTTDTFSLCILK